MRRRRIERASERNPASIGRTGAYGHQPNGSPDILITLHTLSKNEPVEETLPMTDTPHVLIVEDEPDLANLYAAWLDESCSVETAYDGSEALDAIDDTIDVVLLDRRMPGLSGDTVLDAIRDRGLDCRVAMVTAVEPDFDIIGMGFDDYLVKPVSKDDLITVIDQLLLRSTYDEQLQQYFSLAAKKALLDAQKTEAELRSSQEYAELKDQLAVLRTQVDDTMAELFDRDVYHRLCQDITRNTSAATE